MIARLRRLPLRWRVSVLIGGLCTVLAVVGVFAFAAVSSTRHDDRVVRGRWQPAVDSAQALLIGYLDQETGERGYDLTGRAAFLQPFTAGQASADAASRRLDRLVTDAKGQAELAAVQAAYQRWLDEAARPQQAAVQRGDLAFAQSARQQALAKADFDRIRQALAALQQDLQGRRSAAARQALDASGRVYWALGVGAAALLGGIVVAGWLLRRWVLTPVTALQREMRVVADGSYDDPIASGGPPELAALGADAELMRVRIVDELDRSRRAIEALYQSGPVVTDLRAELAATPALQLPGLALHGVLNAAEGVLAGDWYDAVVLADGRTAVLLADVSGHGASAGLIALRVKLVLSSALTLGLSPAQALAHAAAAFAAEDERFASCVVVVVDPAAQRLTWANAGHPAPLLLRRDGSAGAPPAYEQLRPTGPLLSSLEGEWEECHADFPADRLLLGYTDGLTEARDAAGRQLEVTGVVEALAGVDLADPLAVVAACLGTVRAHADDVRRDDVTVVAIAHERRAEPVVG